MAISAILITCITLLGVNQALGALPQFLDWASKARHGPHKMRADVSQLAVMLVAVPIARGYVDGSAELMTGIMTGYELFGLVAELRGPLRPSFMVHHVVSIVMSTACFCFFYAQSAGNVALCMFVFESSMIMITSNIFLIARSMVPGVAIDLLFAVSFIWCRAVEQLLRLRAWWHMHHSQIISHQLLQDTSIFTMTMYLGYFLLFTLNLYWSALLLRSVFRKITGAKRRR